MISTSTMSPALQSEVGTTVDLLDNWFDAIEVGLRERVREFIQAMIESELEETEPNNSNTNSDGTIAHTQIV